MSLQIGLVITVAAMLVGVPLGVIAGYVGGPTGEVIISIGRNYLPTWWWYSTLPGLFIYLTVLGFNLLGDGLRDLLDPKSRTT